MYSFDVRYFFTCKVRKGKGWGGVEWSGSNGVITSLTPHIRGIHIHIHIDVDDDRQEDAEET